MAVAKIAIMVAVVCVIISVTAAGRLHPFTIRCSLASSSSHTPTKFYEAFVGLWGQDHMSVSDDQSNVTMWLDKTSGSGFKSIERYSSGFFSVSMKLPRGYTAGLNIAFYLSNSEEFPNNHDEIDIEFLGTTPGKLYTMQTNIYADTASAGTNRIITGLEQHNNLSDYHTTEFYTYSILWTPSHIVFFSNNRPIRQYTDLAHFPRKPMRVYGSIWDASSWATEDGKYKVDYKYAPFVVYYKDFVLIDCSDNKASICTRRQF